MRKGSRLSQSGPDRAPNKKSLDDNLSQIELLTEKEIAHSGKFSKAHVRNLIASGELPSLLVGRCRRVRLADYLRYLERRQKDNKSDLPEGR